VPQPERTRPLRFEGPELCLKATARPVRMAWMHRKRRPDERRRR
jgi:hypothetical protein